jgi:DNA-binding MarR family transcriptional regulator
LPDIRHPARRPARRVHPDSRRRDEIAAAVDCIRQLVRGLRLAEQRTHAESGLSAAQLFVLAQLSQSSATSLSELAERTLTDRTSVAAVVERLEAARLVTTRRDDEDRRKLLVQISPAGTERLASAPAAPTAMLIDAMQRMQPADVAAMCDSLGRLLQEMGLAGEPAGMLFEDAAVPRTRR